LPEKISRDRDFRFFCPDIIEEKKVYNIATRMPDVTVSRATRRDLDQVMSKSRG
jgi:hypothetical protein